MRNPRFLTALAMWLLASVGSLYAGDGRIFLLIAADTSEKGGIALSTGPDTQFIFDAFYAHVSARQLVIYSPDEVPLDPDDEGTGTDRVYWIGNDIQHDLSDMHNKILKAIDNCPSGADDTIIIFFSGHGAYDNDGHYLLMPDQSATLSRKTILEHLASKNPRLAVLITDTCNTVSERGRKPGPHAKLISPKVTSPLFVSLFLEPRGVVDINSASQGEVAAGPIGGGLLVLSLAYMGDRPTFYAPKREQRQVGEEDEEERGINVERPGSRPGEIPAVDYTFEIAKMFGWNEHGIHRGSDVTEPFFGYLWKHQDQRLSWSQLQDEVTQQAKGLFRDACPDGLDNGAGSVQYTQTPEFYSVPIADQPQAVGRPEADDRIIEVNGQPIHDTDDFWDAVKSSPTTIEFKCVCHRTGRTHVLRTHLNPVWADSRLGIEVEDDDQPGVKVRRVYPGYPGERCQMLR